MENTLSPRPSALFVGAHPDDIEIGAAGTVAKLVQSGWDVGYCVLTGEHDAQVSKERESEAKKAARVLGILPEKMVFLNFPDSHLEATGKTVAKLRKIFKETNIDPDIVFTHTHADSHNDHRAAHDLVLATFRKKPILSFAVVNSLIISEFKPRVFIETVEYSAIKHDALKMHRSQRARIDETWIENLNSSFNPDGGLIKAEPFELVLQEGAEDLLYLIIGINDSPFHNFWYPLLHEQRLLVVHSVPVYRRKKEYGWSVSKEQEGIDLLNETFTKMWYEQNPVTSRSSDNPAVENELYKFNVLLSGSAASNQFTRNYFDHFQGVRYHVGYTMPDYKDLRIIDRVSRKKGYAHYIDDGLGNTMPEKDCGILTIMRNPMRTTRTFFGCMGIHGFGTLGCFKAISDQNTLRELLSFIDIPLQNKGFQVIIDYDIKNNKVTVRKESLHVFTQDSA